MSSRPDQDSAPTRPSIDFAFWGVSLCFILSGMAGLVYQMVWMRHLSTIFGTSELAIVTVLVAYMGGLAVGAGVASRVVHRLRRPIRLYALLEGVIAVSALLVPLLLRAVSGLHRLLLGGQPAPPPDGGIFEALAFLGLGCVVLLIPTACMGATLPILAAGVVRRKQQIGRRVGWLYALNTIGAVGGVVLAAFFLIPTLGLWQTSFVGVGLNLTVAVLGWFVAVRAVSDDRPAESGEERDDGGEPQGGRIGAAGGILLGVMLVSGALSFAYEVLWSRILAHVLGGSLYAFATMLAAFLAGIALGGLLGARLARGRRHSWCWLAGAQVATGLLSAGLFLYVSSDAFAESRTGEASLGSLAGLCAFILMPATLCIGATFPLAVRGLCDDPHEAGRWAGRVYSWNTFGAIVGAIAAGYFMIPALGFAGTVKVAVLGNLGLALVLLVALRPRPLAPCAMAGVLMLGVVLGFHPRPPLGLIAWAPETRDDRFGGAEPELIHHAIGHSSTVSVLKRRGSYLLRTNGLPEAEVFGKGADKLSYTRIRWLPALPKVLRPEAETMLVVGFGGGALLERVPRGFRSIDVVELEQAVIDANEVIADRRAIDPLRDERLRVVVNDARGALGLTAKRYDVIVSQPSHPWTAGASHLYTREFFALVRDHLAEDGVFVQWLGASFVDEPVFRSFAATMLAVFPHTQLYKIADNFLFVGSGTPLDAGFLAGAGPGGSLVQLSDYAKISYVEDVLAVLQLDEEGCRKLADGFPPITDNRNLMATQKSFGRSLEGAMHKHENLERVLKPLHYLNQEKPALLQAPATGEIDHVYFLGLLAASGARQVDLAHVFRKVLPDADQAVYQARRQMGRPSGDALRLLGQALAARPDHATARSYEVLERLGRARRTWMARGLGPSPHDLSDLMVGDPALQAAYAALDSRHRLFAQVEHWALTGQFERIAAVEEELRAFTDHRDPFYRSAAGSLVLMLMDDGGKSEEEQERDARRAAELLDHLLSLPNVDNRSLMAQRIELAQRFGEVDYLVAAGWIMVAKLASAPPGTPEQARDLYRTPLGEILKPYAERTADGRLTFKDATVGAFYSEVRRQVGLQVFPPEYRQ